MHINELPPFNEPGASHSLGFTLLAHRQKLKLDLDAGGVRALASLVQALIASGIVTEEEILDEVCGITGTHCEERVAVMLLEGIDSHWHSNRDGSYSPLHNS